MHNLKIMRFKSNAVLTTVMIIAGLTVFDCSNTGVVGSNPTRGMDVCLRLFCVCVVLCVGSGALRRSDTGPRSPTDCV
jgi:hypothetical protein